MLVSAQVERAGASMQVQVQAGRQAGQVGVWSKSCSPDPHALLNVCGSHLVPEAHHKLCRRMRGQPELHGCCMLAAACLGLTHTLAICLMLITYFAVSVPGFMILVHLATWAPVRP